MKILADEHVSAAIVRLVREYALSDSCELLHVADNDWTGFKDVPLISAFASDGGHALLSADKGFAKHHQQIVAVCTTGLRVAVLPPKWANARRNQQAAYILWWWNRIEEVLANCPERSCWKVPWGMPDNIDRQDLVRIEVNFERARQKAKKADRRAS